MSDDTGDTAGDDKPRLSTEVLVDLREAPSPSAATDYEKVYSRKAMRRDLLSELDFTHLAGTRDHYRHKKYWSWFLMCSIGGMVLFQTVLLTLVGSGVLDFTDYDWLLPALLVQNLGQVVGLAVYAVRNLFSDISGTSRTAGRSEDAT